MGIREVPAHGPYAVVTFYDSEGEQVFSVTRPVVKGTYSVEITGLYDVTSALKLILDDEIPAKAPEEVPA